jgi:hypothetical protein
MRRAEVLRETTATGPDGEQLRVEILDDRKRPARSTIRRTRRSPGRSRAPAAQLLRQQRAPLLADPEVLVGTVALAALGYLLRRVGR